MCRLRKTSLLCTGLEIPYLISFTGEAVRIVFPYKKSLLKSPRSRLGGTSRWSVYDSQVVAMIHDPISKNASIILNSDLAAFNFHQEILSAHLC